MTVVNPLWARLLFLQVLIFTSTAKGANLIDVNKAKLIMPFTHSKTTKH